MYFSKVKKKKKQLILVLVIGSLPEIPLCQKNTYWEVESLLVELQFFPLKP